MRRGSGAGARAHRPRAVALRIAVLAALGVAPAAGQPGGGAPDLADLALDWARGEFGAPLLCELDGTPQRGFRRVLISPGPRGRYTPANRLRLFDLDAPGATRCFDDLGADQPNLVGTLLLDLPGPSRPDTAQRDFAAALRRERGFAFRIAEGRLRVETVGAASATRLVDFGDGVARLRALERGSDLARLLREYEGARRLVLTLEATDGTQLVLPLVQYAKR